MSRLIVVGSINQDMLVEIDRQPQPGETLAAEKISYAPGGKGANQAVAGALAGSSVLMLGAVGDDAFGSQLIDNLAAKGIATENIVFKTGVSTGLAIVVISSGNNSIIIIPGANGKLTPEDLKDITLLPEDIILAQCEIPQETSLAVFKKAREAGASCILNPAPASHLNPELIASSDYLILNEIELAEILESFFDFEGNVETSSAEIHNYLLEIQARFGLKAAVCTLGADGVRAVSGKDKYELAALNVEVLDTTGAGDCFVGVFAASLLSGKNFADSLAYANLGGSLSVQGIGAQTAMPTYAELENAHKHWRLNP